VSERARVAWRLCDGRRGHEVQSLGLLEALAELVALERHDLEVRGGPLAVLGALAAARRLPAPDLLVGAGHATHLPLLALRARHGGRALVLMRPSLPCGWFDLCLVPAHDRAAGPRVLVTRGVLNRVRPAAPKDPRRGLILLGGPSRHHRWSAPAVLEQVRAICAHDPAQRWVATTSRRTPPDTAARLAALGLANLEVVEHDRVAGGWLPEQLAGAARAWVSEDSVSMVYEALTAGAATGLIELEGRGRRDRVSAGLEGLVEEGRVVRFSDWHRGRALVAPPVPLAEARRCARWIAERWLASGP